MKLKNSWQLKSNFEKYITQYTGYRTKRDFKNLTKFDFTDFSGGQVGLLETKSYFRFLEWMYPSFQWTLFDIGRVSNYIWTSGNMEKIFLESISIPSDIRRQEDWKLMDIEEMKKLHGGTLLKRNYSILRILEKNFPEYFWELNWRFPSLSCFEKRRNYIDSLILNQFCFVESQEDLAHITYCGMSQNPAGRTILFHYNENPQAVFQEHYPELTPAVGKRAPSLFWSNVRKNDLLQRVIKFYKIKSIEDWYRLSYDQFSLVYGKQVIKRNIIKLFQFWYPEENWDYYKLSERINKRSQQRFLGLRLAEMFKGEVIFEDYVVKLGSGSYVFDFYVPSLGLVVEYQGEQHYYSVLKWLSIEEQKKRDEEKNEMCLENGLRLVHVPYWWDNTDHSLHQIISSALQNSITTQKTLSI